MKKIIIVGAGVSGISAGIYARQCGFDVDIYEKHFMTGGVCTSWSRKGYTFEGAVHWLTDALKDRPFYRIWEETGAFDDSVKTYRNDPYTSLEYNNDVINLYRDITALKAELMRVSPEDEKAINILCKDIKALCNMGMPILDVKGVKAKYKIKFDMKQAMGMMPAIPKMGKLMSQTVGEYVSMFKNEGIKTILNDLMPPEYCAMALISTMATFQNSGQFPEGGALGLVKRITNKLTELGGKIHLSTPVDKIVVENNKAVGVIVNGETILADAVIVTRDIVSADSLFDNPPKDQWIQNIRETSIAQTCTFISVGVKADLSDLPKQFHFFIDKPLEIAGKKHDRFGFTQYSDLKEYAPEGCTALTSLILDYNYEWWSKARKEGRYDEEKAKIAQAVKDILESKFSKMKGNIEVIDIATPLTYQRYTGSDGGAWMTVMKPNQKMSFNKEMGYCKDIKNVYFAGFRMQSPGGLPVALNSGRIAVQYICRDFDVVFQGEK